MNGFLAFSSPAALALNAFVIGVIGIVMLYVLNYVFKLFGVNMLEAIEELNAREGRYVRHLGTTDQMMYLSRRPIIPTFMLLFGPFILMMLAGAIGVVYAGIWWTTTLL